MSPNRCLKQIVDECYTLADQLDMNPRQWALAAGLGDRTVYRIATGETKFPRFQTVVAMAQAVGMRLTVVQIQKLKRKAG